MPTWQVRDAHVDYRLFDTPLKYIPAYGPSVALNLAYQTWRTTDYGYYPRNDSNPLFGPTWHCAWSSDLVIHDPANGWRSYWNYLGGRVIYPYQGTALTSDPAYEDGSRLEIVKDASDNVIGGRIHRANGQTLEYLQVSSTIRFLLTRLSEPDGQALTFSYDIYGRLSEIVAATGQTTTLVYGDLDTDGLPDSDRVVTEINAPEGYVTSFGYQSFDDGDPSTTDWYLTSITDTEGITSSFTYRTETNGMGSYRALETLVTPYGTNRFEYLSGPTNMYGRTLLVTEPGGRQHLYVQGETNNIAPIPENFPASMIPDGVPVGTLDTNRQQRNSFYWGPKQLAAIGNLAVNNWTSNDFRLALTRHWLGHFDPWDGGHQHISETLSWEQQPSPDGIIGGRVTWYDYAGKINPERIGDRQQPAVIARKLPDGTTWYEYSEHNSLGNPTSVVSTYTTVEGTVGTRTNSFVYAENGIDLLSVTNAAGVQEHAYGYNTNHQILATTNALGSEYTLYTYDGNGRLTSTTLPAGLVTTNIYAADGRLAKTIDLQISRTNSFTWTNGNVRTHTNELGLGRTFTYDTLARLARIDYPDSTYEEYRYTKDGTTNGIKWLDLTYHRDRMGYVTKYTYNGVRQQTSVIDPRNNTTTNIYCTCGALESTTDALTNTTTFIYDHQGRLTATLYADGYKVTNHYNSLGQVTNLVDSSGSSTTNWYNNQGLLMAVSNSFGRVQTTAYDIEDQAATVVDANGVVITNAYDDLGRLIARGYPDAGVERFGYSARGLIAYTNQLSTNVTWYAYDEAGRKTAETNANNELMRFKYDASGNLTNLIDGRTNNTFWIYDMYGRVTDKIDHNGTYFFSQTYDANGRVINRWVPDKETSYDYDANGNVTSINYSNSTDLSFAYDALNRITNMVDAAGTTKYTYSAFGAVLAEDGPWENDTVTYNYTNRLRSALNLQQPNASPWLQTYGYDPARRLQTLTSPAGAFAYDYKVGQASLPAKISLPNGSYITNSYDGNARMLSTALKNSTNWILSSHSYGYDLGYQCTTAARANGITNAYTYDSLGQVTEALCSSRPHERFSYRYDKAGNLTNRFGGVNPNQTFSINNLNQLTTLNRSSTGPVVGTTSEVATNVTVNGGNATLHADNTFYRQFSFVDGTNTFTAIGQDANGRRDTNVVTAYLPVTASFTYDWNGNLVYDGRKAFEYDDENQLTAVTLTNAWRSEFAYDGKMRRRIRKEYIWQGTWVLSNEVRYVYDGNLVIQERNIWNLPQVGYTRGRDLSGSLEGAGGIGGLLARADQSAITPQQAYYHSDGNGNVTMLINTQQLAVAKYLYDPFGNVISMSGPLAGANLYRFSSKEWHANSGLVYYLYRYYEPSLQRWVNRDPLADSGFRVRVPAISNYVQLSEPRFGLARYILTESLYGFTHNNPINSRDSFGLWTASCRVNCSALFFNLSFSFNVDGNRKFQSQVSGGIGFTGGASLTAGGTFTTADKVDDLQGGSHTVGLTAGEGVVGEVNYIKGADYIGGDIGLGAGVGLPFCPQYFYNDTAEIWWW